MGHTSCGASSGKRMILVDGGYEHLAEVRSSIVCILLATSTLSLASLSLLFSHGTTCRSSTTLVSPHFEWMLSCLSPFAVYRSVLGRILKLYPQERQPNTTPKIAFIWHYIRKEASVQGAPEGYNGKGTTQQP